MAGNTLMSLLVKLGIDTSEFEAGMTEAQKQAQTAGKNLSKLGGSIAKTGAMATAAVTVPLAMAANSMISSASDLNETMSKVQVVFGSTASEVMAFGDTAAKSLGMSKNEALAAAGVYGNLFRAMNMTETVSAEMSTSLVSLAGDLASFNNMDPTEVMDKLRAGLSGESEPLKSLGVNINEAIIKSKALEMGLYSGTGAMDAATKAQATYALILEQTSLAHGDFARTSDGLANSQRIMKAELGDVSAKLGTQLLPIALKVVTALSGMIDKLSNMSPAGQKVILIIGGILAVIGPLLTTIGTVISVVGTLSAFLAGPAAAAIGAVLVPILPIIGIIAAVIAVVGLLYAAWKNNWFGIRDITSAAINQIVNFWNSVLLPAIKTVANFVGNVLGAAFNSVKNAIMGVWNWIQKLAGALTNITLPKWMTPGSPTPWEIGLRGVSSAMGQLDSSALPGLGSALGSLNASFPAANSLGNQGGAVSSNKNLSVIINNPVGQTTNDSVNQGLQRLAFLGVA